MSALKFLGLSVSSFNASLGLNSTPSTLTVILAQDIRDGDVFSNPSLGTPVTFTAENYSFSGIISRWEKKTNTSGQLYEVQIEDIRGILSGVQLITGYYNGATSAIPNLINVYGYLENLLGFGGSGLNSSGIPWNNIYDVIHATTASVLGTSYGGPISYRGKLYKIDLTEISPYSNYRIGSGGSISLLEAVGQVCEDTGREFYIEMTAGTPLNTITFHTISRVSQPPLGTIGALITEGGTSSSSEGLELRQEDNSVFLVGANQSTLYQTSSLAQFWGFDINGNPLLDLGQGVLPADVNIFNDPAANADDPNAKNCLTANNCLKVTNPKCKFYTGMSVYRCDIIFDADAHGNVNPVPKIRSNTFLGYLAPKAGVVNPPESNEDNPFAYVFWRVVDINGQQVLADLDTNSELQNIHFIQQWIRDTQFLLNASEIADILGSPYYACSYYEIRFALQDIDSWETFCTIYKQGLPYFAHMAGAKDLDKICKLGNPNQWFVKNRAKADKIRENVNAINAGDDNGISMIDADIQRIYDFVRRSAEEFYGRKFLVSIPFELLKVEPDSLAVQYSHEYDDGGGYVEEGVSPLGLQTQNYAYFTTQDNRFVPFVKFLDADLALADVSLLPESDFISQNGINFTGDMFVKGRVDPKIIFAPSPTLLVEIARPIFLVDEDNGFERHREVAEILGHNLDLLERIVKNFWGTATFEIYPPCIYPTAAAIPLKSNILTYGPWYALGAIGKVRFERDDSLAPWNYGGYAGLELAALAKVNNGYTNQQVSETGSIEYAGLPNYALGTTLSAGGPNIMNIDVSYGIDGAKTNYRFATYINKFGSLNKGYTDRLVKNAMNLTKVKNNLINTTNSLYKNVGTIIGARNGALPLKDKINGLNKVKKWQTPHSFLFANLIEAPDVSGLFTTHVATCDSIEGAALVNGPGTDYRYKSLISLDGMFRPFSTRHNDSYLSSYNDTNAILDQNVISNVTYNPFREGHENYIMTHGDSFKNMDQITTPSSLIEYDNIRGISLRGPLMLTGYGYDFKGGPTPSSGNNQYVVGHLYKSNQWKTGPVDLRYDENRGVWTASDLLLGKIRTEIGVGGSAIMDVWNGSVNIQDNLYVYNWFDTTLRAGAKVVAGYIPQSNKWYVMQNDFSFQATNPSGVTPPASSIVPLTSYRMTALLDWPNTSDLDLYSHVSGQPISYYARLSAGGLVLNKDAHPICAATPLRPEINTGDFTTYKAVRYYYNQYSNCSAEQTPTNKYVVVYNLGNTNITANGTTITPTNSSIFGPIHYMGYNTGDLHTINDSAFNSGLLISVYV